MAFSNRIRLPIQIHHPQYPQEKVVYRKADGVTKVLSVIIKKTYQGESDYMPEKWHEKLAIALGHDMVIIEGDKYLGGVSQDGDYNIEWNTTFKDYPTAKAKFAVEVTPFDATNSNCMSCEEATQLELVDDTFPGTMSEGDDFNINVADNDKICCYPAIFSITSYDTTYLRQPPIIDDTGLLVVFLSSPVQDANGVKLLTYRVTCPNGGFDEADVFGTINGSITPTCLAPTALTMFSSTSTIANVEFRQPATLPDHYHLILYKTATPGITEQTTNIAASGAPLSFKIGGFTGLTPGTDYTICVRSQCDATNDDATASNYICISFTTSPVSQLCAQYGLFYNDPTAPGPGAGGHINATYVDCNGNTQVIYVPNGVSRGVCAMQTGPGSPTYIAAFPTTYFHYTYEGPGSC